MRYSKHHTHTRTSFFGGGASLQHGRTAKRGADRTRTFLESATEHVFCVFREKKNIQIRSSDTRQRLCSVVWMFPRAEVHANTRDFLFLHSADVSVRKRECASVCVSFVNADLLFRISRMFGANHHAVAAEYKKRLRSAPCVICRLGSMVNLHSIEANGA